jgi:hypothetical protein
MNFELKSFFIIEKKIACEDLYKSKSSTSLCVSHEVTEWGGPSDETGKTDAPFHSRCGDKDPVCSKALSTKHTSRLKFCSPSPVMVTSPHE